MTTYASEFEDAGGVCVLDVRIEKNIEKKRFDLNMINVPAKCVTKKATKDEICENVEIDFEKYHLCKYQLILWHQRTGVENTIKT